MKRVCSIDFLSLTESLKIRENSFRCPWHMNIRLRRCILFTRDLTYTMFIKAMIWDLVCWLILLPVYLVSIEAQSTYCLYLFAFSSYYISSWTLFQLWYCFSIDVITFSAVVIVKTPFLMHTHLPKGVLHALLTPIFMWQKKSSISNCFTSNKSCLHRFIRITCKIY